MKKYLLAIGAVAITGSLLAVGTASGDLDLPYLQQRIDNHEARITNNEQDIQALQTSTAPTAHVDVPPAPVRQEATSAPATPAPTPSSTPAPVSAAPTEATPNTSSQSTTCDFTHPVPVCVAN